MQVIVAEVVSKYFDDKADIEATIFDRENYTTLDSFYFPPLHFSFLYRTSQL